MVNSRTRTGPGPTRVRLEEVSHRRHSSRKEKIVCIILCWRLIVSHCRPSDHLSLPHCCWAAPGEGGGQSRVEVGLAAF